MADAKAQDIIKHRERLDADRGTVLSHWQECADYLNPDRADYTVTRTPGGKRMQKVFDSYPIWCREQFAAGCHSYLTSATIPWFSLAADFERLNAIPAVRTWFDVVTAVMYAVFNSPRYHFATQSHEVYDDIGTIGSAAMVITEGRDGLPRFSARHMRECLPEENEEGVIDTVIRRWQWTAKQAWQEWGPAAGEKVAKAYAEDRTNEKFWFLHRVMPRKSRDPRRADNQNMAFESVYVSEADQTVISESGMNEFPYVIPRYAKSPGETFGRGPGQTALPHVKMLNLLAAIYIKSAQKIMDPPLEVPDDGYVMPIRATPGSLIFRRAGLRPDDRITPIVTGANLSAATDMQRDLRSAIGQIFYVDLLHMPQDFSNPASEGKGSTATYWMQRREKEMNSLSPFLSRMNDEWSGRTIDRTFAILWRKSVSRNFGPGSPFPPPPEELSGQSWHAEYISPIALAQRGSETDAIERLIARQMELRNIDPQSPLYLDSEFIMRRTARDVNAPESALKSVERLQQEAEAQREQQERMQQQAEMVSGAGALRDAAAAGRDMQEAG